MKLFTKYNRLNLVIMVAIFILTSIVYYFLLRYVLIEELDEDLFEKKRKIEQYVAAKKSLPTFENLDDVIVFYSKASSYSDKASISQVIHFDREEKLERPFRQLQFFQYLEGIPYLVTVIKPVEGIQSLFRAIALITMLTILLIIVTSILLNRLLLKRLWHPFYEIIATVRRFKLGKKEEPVFVQTDIDEFTFLNDNLQETITAAQNDYRVLKEFTENASHESQTPLAIIRSKLDLLIQEDTLSEHQTQLLGEAYGAIKKLSRLNQSLLLLTKIENHLFRTTEVLDLKQKIDQKVRQFSELWQNNQMKVKVDLSEVYLQANPDLVDSLLNNLLSNASRHNTAGGNIFITLDKDKLVVENTAIGGELDRSRIFRRFYKEDPAMHSNGLGLSIIKEICDQTNIRIMYAFNGSGHVFTLELPSLLNNPQIT